MSAPVQILLVEDNPLDVRAMLRAAERMTVPRTVEVVNDGEAAIARLTGAGTGRPDLVLLDLDLPGKNGHDVLEVIKADPTLRRMPVVVLTTSDAEDDIVGAYDRGANAFLTKPVSLEGWQHLIEQIEGFWFSAAKLPRT